MLDKITSLLKQNEYTNVVYQQHTELNQVRTKLNKEGITTIYISLDEFGSTATLESFYFDLADIISDSLEIDINLESWWKEVDLPPNLTLSTFLEELALNQASSLAIFIDRTENFLNFKYTDIGQQFIPLIRSYYEQRKEYEHLKRLTFCLSGDRHPIDILRKLTPPDQHFTPYNIGKTVKI